MKVRWAVTIWAATIWIAISLLGESAIAQDYSNSSFSLRLPAALTRFAGYADVAACGNASAASKWSTSINPASTGWQPAAPGSLGVSLTPQFSLINFQNDSNIYVTSQAVGLDTKSIGVFLPAAAEVWSNRADTSLGLDFKINSQVYQIQWGFRPWEKWAIGANLNFSDSTVDFSQAGTSFSHTQTQFYDLRIGGLYQFVPKWRVGLVADFGGSLSHSDSLIPTNTGFFPVSARSSGEQFLLQPGICWEYLPDASIYADYQLGAFWDSSAGHLIVNRFAIGVDHQLFKGIYVRAGINVDTTGQFGWTCGAAVSPAPWMSIDVAYQHDFFPELTPELGHSNTFTCSLSFAF